MSATVPSQRLGALERAREVKRQRLELLGGGYGVKIPAERMAELILECPPALATMEILLLLGHTQGFGVKRNRVSQRLRGERLLAAVGITSNRRLGELSARQRAVVAEHLRAG